MSQVGKLYKFYFGKIWQKNWLRIIIFTILIGIVWWFVIPWGVCRASKGIVERYNEEEYKNLSKDQLKKWEEMNDFSSISRREFGGEKFDGLKKSTRKFIEEKIENLKEGEGKDWDLRKKMLFWTLRAHDNGVRFLTSTPYTADNAFFFSQTEGYKEGKNFWQLLFDIAWWNLAGSVILYWFIFEIFDKTFSSPRQDGEEAMVLTMTPGVQRSDLLWGKIFAFLTFYFLINVVLFLIPFGIYYWWLATERSIVWFSLLALITTIVGPILFFGLIFAPYLFITSVVGGWKWIFSLLISFFPMIWGGIKMFSAVGWPYTIESVLFDPIWFTVISLVCGIFFLTLYYLRYQEEDLG